MARANPPGLSLVAEFDAYCKQLRFDIEQRFDELIERIRKRQSDLMEKLEVLQFLGREEMTIGDCEIQDIERFRAQSKQNIEGSYSKNLRTELFENLDGKIMKIRADASKNYIKFAWEDNLLIQAIDNLGKLDVKDTVTQLEQLENKQQDIQIVENPPKQEPKELDDYDKEYPKMSVCKIGSKPGELKNPFGICIHLPTNNIYVADNENNRIQVFNDKGVFLFKFGDSAGKGKLTSPYAVAIFGERVFVTEYRSACILTYEIGGVPILQLGTTSGAQKGYMSLLFSGDNFLSGLAFDKRTNGFLVCDYASHSIHVFDFHLNFQKSFGSKVLFQPRDVIVTSSEFLVLDSGQLCLHLFDFHFNLKKNFVSRGGVGKDVFNPWFFCISSDATIYMTDITKNCIYVIDCYGNMLRQIGTEKGKELFSPKGIVIDTKGRLIVVDNKSKGCLQTF